MSTPPTPTEPTTLTDRLRARAAGLLDPVVTFLARIGVSPDMLTVVGMLLHLLFAWLIATGEFLWAGIAIFIFVPLDALDGALARKIGRQGAFGAFLDSNSDRVAEIILYSGYISWFTQQEEFLVVAAAYAAATGSLMVSYSRARAESLGYSCKVGLFSRVERYVVIVASLVLDFPAIGLYILAIGTWFTFVQRVYHVWKQARDSTTDPSQ
ncbi:MAG: CDP-alcohol phosphatidyltransferase family protein [Chloroflexota bacterium]|nr:MAG: CDP-alcohol phosphatidyltransferase family protein [Chloroflexota bacterium]